MSCRTHPSAPGAGVCAFCLCERLSSLTAATSEDEETKNSPEHGHDRCLYSQPPAPLLHLQSDVSHVAQLQHVDHLDVGCCITCQKQNTGKFCLLSQIWSNQIPKKVESTCSISWPLSLILAPGRIKRNKNRKKRMPSPSVVTRKPHVTARGMSPVEEGNVGVVDLKFPHSTEPSSCHRISTPPPIWRKAAAFQQQSPFSSFSVCMSPFVSRNTGNRRWHPPTEMAFPGELWGGLNRRRTCGSGGFAGREVSSGFVPLRSRNQMGFW